MGIRLGVGLVAAVGLLAGCGGGQEAAPASQVSPASALSASTTTAEAVQSASAAARALNVPSVVKVVDLTEDTDPNNLIGRPNGYTAASVIYDSGASCVSLGVSCGATVEQWATPADAQRRADSIQQILTASPVLGSEYHSVRGPLLLRASGKLKSSVWATYQAAFVK